MATTLTREQILDKGKARYEEVEVPGYGTVGIRSTSLLQQSHRSSRLFDEDGKLVQREVDLRQAHMIIDQVMIDESTPMFAAGDAEMVAALDPSSLQPLLEAIRTFNEDGEVMEKKDESDDSSES